MSKLCKNPAMLFHVDMIYLAKQAKRDVEKSFAFGRKKIDPIMYYEGMMPTFSVAEAPSPSC